MSLNSLDYYENPIFSPVLDPETCPQNENEQTETKELE